MCLEGMRVRTSELLGLTSVLVEALADCGVVM